MENRRCPECQANNHDQGNDAGHLFLSNDGSKWLCDRTKYHTSGLYCVIRHDPVTNAPEDKRSVEEKVKEEVPEDNTFEWEKKVQRVDPIDFRGIPAAVSKRYGVLMEINSEGEVEKVLYPVYEGGVLTAYKVREVKVKRFYKMPLSGS